MASINATTSSGIVATADNTGQLQLQSAGTTVMTITSTGVTTQVGAPSFSAYVNNNFSTTANVFAKVQCNVEEWDTGNCFDSTTNYRFTPNVAGYYQFSGGIVFNGTTTRLIITLYKNGSEIKKLFDSASTWQQGYGSAMIYCNGTTDYVELYCRSANNNTVVAGSIESYFQGFLARSA
jgi:hypothetical protein